MRKTFIILLSVFVSSFLFSQKKNVKNKTKTYQYEEVGNDDEKMTYQQMLDGKVLKFIKKYPPTENKNTKKEILIEDREIKIYEYTDDLPDENDKNNQNLIGYYEMDIDRDFMVFIDKKDNKRYRYKILTNKDKIEIIKLQDLRTKDLFEKVETPSVYPPITEEKESTNE